MERIVIEVDSETAKKWKFVPKSTKNALSKSFAKTIESSFSEKEDYWQFLEKGRKVAEKKGFNDEILKEILSEE